MSTFNGKPQAKNILAVILGILGIHLLLKTWAYHQIVQVLTLPKEQWLNPFDKSTWVIRAEYPNGFCKYFCNIEATLINQLYLLRIGFGTEYCAEASTEILTTGEIK